MKDLSSLISGIVELRNLMDSLSSKYEEVARIIEEEHEYVRHSDLSRLAETTEKKISLAEVLETETQRLFMIFEKVREEVGYYQKDCESPVDLTTLVSNLKVLKFENSLESNVMDFEVLKLEKSVQNFMSTKGQYQPKVEMNRYLLNKVLKNHQETFRFWQSLAAESEAIYGEKGTAKAQTSEPILRVRT